MGKKHRRGDRRDRGRKPEPPRLSPKEEYALGRAKVVGLWIMFERTVWRVYSGATGRVLGWMAPHGGDYEIADARGREASFDATLARFADHARGLTSS